MAQPAQLRADDFIFARFRGRKMDRKIQPRYEILVDAQRRHVKGMTNIFGMHEQMDFLVYGNSHLRRYNVVPGIRVVFWIKTEEILVSLIDQLRMKWTKLFICTWVAEIESELSGLDLNGEGGGRRWREIYGRPRLHSKGSQGQNLRANEH